MAINAIRFYPEPLRSIGFGSITNSYNAIGSPFAHPISWIHLVNDTDAALTFSWDGTDDHLYLPAGAFLVMDVTTNQSATGGLFFVVNQRIFVEYAISAPTSGIVTLSAFYAI